MTCVSVTPAIFFKTPSNARSVIVLAFSGFRVRVAITAWVSASAMHCIVWHFAHSPISSSLSSTMILLLHLKQALYVSNFCTPTTLTFLTWVVRVGPVLPSSYVWSCVTFPMSGISVMRLPLMDVERNFLPLNSRIDTFWRW